MEFVLRGPFAFVYVAATLMDGVGWGWEIVDPGSAPLGVAIAFVAANLILIGTILVVAASRLLARRRAATERRRSRTFQP